MGEELDDRLMSEYYLTVQEENEEEEEEAEAEEEVEEEEKVEVRGKFAVEMIATRRRG